MVDSSIPVSLYQQLKEILLNKIITREWPQGYKIPTEKELCEQYKVSRITIRQALRDLEEAGYITRHAGKGTFVKESKIDQKLSRFYSFSEAFEKKGYVNTAKLLSFTIGPSDSVVSEKLELLENEPVIAIRRVRLADELPYAIETSYLPYKLFPSLTAEMIEKDGLYNSMRTMGLYPDKATETIGAKILTKEDAAILETEVGSAALSVIRTTRCKSACVEYCDSIVRGDKFSYTIDMK